MLDLKKYRFVRFLPSLHAEDGTWVSGLMGSEPRILSAKARAIIGEIVGSCLRIRKDDDE